MKCAMCNRPLLVAAASVPTRNGPISYGPVCAKKAGLGHPRINHPHKSAQRAVKRHARGVVVVVTDGMTMDLFLEGMK